MKKILFILTGLTMGGGENLTVNIIELLDKSKYEIKVLCYSKEANSFLTERLKNMGIEVVYIFRKYKFDFSIIFKIKKFLLEYKPDVIHSHLSTLTYALYGIRKSKPLVVLDTTHSMAYYEYKKPIHIKAYKKAFHKFGVIPVAIGEQVKKSMMDMFNLESDNIVTIVNGIDLSKFICKKEYLSNKKLVTIARLEEVKNQILSVRAMQHVVKKDHTVKLFLYGTGTQEKVLLEEIIKLDLLDNVFLMGLTTNVPQALLENDIYLSSSKVEGLPLGFVEAMAVGLPIIATNVGGVPDVVTNEINGFLVDDFNPENLADYILKLTSNLETCKEISLANIEKAKVFDINAMVKKYEKIYNKE